MGALAEPREQVRPPLGRTSAGGQRGLTLPGQRQETNTQAEVVAKHCKLQLLVRRGSTKNILAPIRVQVEGNAESKTKIIKPFPVHHSSCIIDQTDYLVLTGPLHAKSVMQRDHAW